MIEIPPTRGMPRGILLERATRGNVRGVRPPMGVKLDRLEDVWNAKTKRLDEKRKRKTKAPKTCNDTSGQPALRSLSGRLKQKLGEKKRKNVRLRIWIWERNRKTVVFSAENRGDFLIRPQLEEK